MRVLSTTDDSNPPSTTYTSPIDDYWIDNYSSISRALESQTDPTISSPSPPNPKYELVLRNRLKSPYFPLFIPDITIASYPNSIASPRPPNTPPDNNITSIYPSEIISPISSRSPDGNSIESPLKSVRFAYPIFHAPSLPVTPQPQDYNNNNSYYSSTTVDVYERLQSDAKIEKRNRRRSKVEARPILDPNPPPLPAIPEGLLRGGTPSKMTSRSKGGKRVEAEFGRSDSVRNRGYESMLDREYGPPATPRPIRPAARDLDQILDLEKSLLLDAFTTEDAYALGTALHDRLAFHLSPATISISLSSGLVLFHCTTKPGATLDSACLVERKRNTVLRFGVSTWYLERKYDGDAGEFERRCGIRDGDGGVLGVGGTGGKGRGKYSCVGGGLPLRVRGVEGVVAVVCVCGLGGEENHGVIVETIQENWY